VTAPFEVTISRVAAAVVPLPLFGSSSSPSPISTIGSSTPSPPSVSSSSSPSPSDPSPPSLFGSVYSPPSLSSSSSSSGSSPSSPLASVVLAASTFFLFFLSIAERFGVDGAESSSSMGSELFETCCDLGSDGCAFCLDGALCFRGGPRRFFGGSVTIASLVGCVRNGAFFAADFGGRPRRFGGATKIASVIGGCARDGGGISPSERGWRPSCFFGEGGGGSGGATTFACLV